jgi:hypothetical protein
VREVPYNRHIYRVVSSWVRQCHRHVTKIEVADPRWIIGWSSRKAEILNFCCTDPQNFRSLNDWRCEILTCWALPLFADAKRKLRKSEIHCELLERGCRVAMNILDLKYGSMFGVSVDLISFTAPQWNLFQRHKSRLAYKLVFSSK